MEKKEIQAFIEYLYENEKSEHTIEKYERDVKQFYRYLKDAPLEKKAVREYKNELMKEYALRSINSMLASLNSYFRFIGKEELRMKSIKIQKEVFAEERKNLKKKEYHRLIEAAQGDERMKLLLDTEVTAKFNLLAEGQQAILEKLVPMSRIEAVEADIAILKQAVRAMNQEIDELKKAQ